MTRPPVPSETLTALARTRPSPTTTAALRAALHARRMLLLKSLLVRVERRRTMLPAAVLHGFERDWALLVRAERADPSAAREVVDYPMTGAWLAEALAAPDGEPFARQLAPLGGVAIAAAVRAGCDVGGTVGVPSGALNLPGLGMLHCPSGLARLSGRAGLVRITDDGGDGEAVLRRTPSGPVGSGPGWAALHTLPGSAVVLDDLDPYRSPPRGSGPRTVRAAEHTAGAHRTWAVRWCEALDLLATTDPGRVAETGTVLRAVVPLSAPLRTGGLPVGATLRIAPGAALIQLPARAWQLANSLVHETHHTKLALLDEVLPLCRPGGGALLRVAWRSDPRPVPAVVQGVYAHLALADLWWRAVDGPGAADSWGGSARERLEAYREGVGEALSLLLESDELTFAGREFVLEMGRHHASLGVVGRNVS
ncbi:HEXXH motif-containing putative peptide modification protein [Streptomyces sp. NPDC046805]|uniref:aKG-HExxH-type peptide beta-hydroxylase n=1 Tax=Streptomyces sp. NPDC046805 TaxID=3155134 RepID=UPI0033FDEE48